MTHPYEEINVADEWESITLHAWGIYSTYGGFQLGPFDLSIRRSSILGIIGNSGAGKSLFIKSILGVLPTSFKYHPEASISIEYKATPPKTWLLKKMMAADWRKLREFWWGYLPQDPTPSFSPVMRLHKQLGLISRNRIGQVPQHEIENRLNILGLDTTEMFLKRYPHQLSGGQAQRIAYLFATIRDPIVLLADEPTASLDASLIDLTGKLIKEWSSKASSSSAIISSHDWKFLESLCNEILVLSNGQIVEQGNSVSFFSHPVSSEAKLMRDSELKRTNLTGTDNPSPNISIRIQGVTKSYGRQSNQPALQGITFPDLYSGRVGILGASGSGKSTLARIISGIIPPDSGDIRINDVKINFQDPHRFKGLARQVQYISQDPFSAFTPGIRIGETIEQVVSNLFPDLTSTQIDEKLSRWVEKCHLAKVLLERYPEELSGGERQRFCLIRALACNPNWLILDEVTASLDHTSRKAILDLILEIALKEKISYYLISHDPDVIRYMCDEYIMLENGKMISCGNIDDLNVKV